VLIACRRDKLGYHVIKISGSAMAYVAFVMVIVYCFKTFTIIFFLKCSNFSEYHLYTGCPRRKGPNFGRVFLRSNYTDLNQNTDIQSSMVTEILAREKCGCLLCLRTLLCP